VGSDSRPAITRDGRSRGRGPGADKPDEPAVRHDLIGRTIGQFRVRSVIGTGGMGTVFEAVQEQPHRTVALKVMNRGVASRSALRRFQYEAQTLARMDHPGIARIHDAGMHDEGAGGVPWFAMEYIAGAKDILKYAESKSLDTQRRLELFVDVCDAVNHGHQKGIVHRDLKPSNILVDAAGRAKIIDFGVARATDSDLAVTTLQTDIGQLIGTPLDMSPEQIEADPHSIDTRSDVYSLSVVLFELLCGRLPYRGTLNNPWQLTRTILEQPPCRLSAIDTKLRGDIETIVLKGLDKDRDQRYQSAAQLAQDIRRFLAGEPILARAPSLSYQVRMLVKRHRWRVISAMTAAVAIIAIAFDPPGDHLYSGSGDTTLRAWQMNEIAMLEDYRGGRQWSVAKRRESVRLRGHESSIRDIDVSPSGLVACGARDGAVKLWSPYVSDVHILRGHRTSVTSVTFDPGGQYAYSTSSIPDSCLFIWDVERGDLAARNYVRDREGFNDVTCVATPEGTLTAGATGAYPETARVLIWRAVDPVAPELVTALEPGPEIMVQLVGVTLSADGTRVAAGAADGQIKVWDLHDLPRHRAIAILRGHRETVGTLLFIDEAGRYLVSASGHPRGARPGLDSSIRLWDVETGGQPRLEPHAVLEGHTGGVYCVAFHPSEPRLASGSADRTIKLWDTESLAEVATLRGHAGLVRDLAFDAQGDRLASASFGFEGTDNVVRLWETQRSRAFVEHRAVTRRASQLARRLLGRPLLLDEGYRLIDEEAALPAEVREEARRCFDRLWHEPDILVCWGAWTLAASGRRTSEPSGPRSSERVNTRRHCGRWRSRWRCPITRMRSRSWPCPATGWVATGLPSRRSSGHACSCASRHSPRIACAGSSWVRRRARSRRRSATPRDPSPGHRGRSSDDHRSLTADGGGDYAPRTTRVACIVAPASASWRRPDPAVSGRAKNEDSRR
jgi:serine/threonine protein kinase